MSRTNKNDNSGANNPLMAEVSPPSKSAQSRLSSGQGRGRLSNGQGERLSSAQGRLSFGQARFSNGQGRISNAHGNFSATRSFGPKLGNATELNLKPPGGYVPKPRQNMNTGGSNFNSEDIKHPKESKFIRKDITPTSSNVTNNTNTTPKPTTRLQERLRRRNADADPENKTVSEILPTANPGDIKILSRTENVVNKDEGTKMNKIISPDSKSKVDNKKKNERKKEKAQVKTDKETNNEPGSLFTRQWPKIVHIFECDASIASQFDSTALVSEKLDGSNISISNKNYLTSRRNILLNNPTEEELKKFKFSGQKVGPIFEQVDKVQQLHHKFEDCFPFLEIETLVYGELIQAGTSTSKEDKYKYREKGYDAGDFVVFGCGICFEDTLDSDQMSMAKEHLIAKGFNVMIVEDTHTNTHYLVILMNDVLKKYLLDVGITKIIKFEETTIDKCLKTYCNQLTENRVEGIIITLNSLILKWKGVEENYPDSFMQTIEDLYKAIRFMHPGKEESVNYMRKVAQASSKQRKMKTSSRSVQGSATKVSGGSIEDFLESAYNSARSKYPRMEELWNLKKKEKDNQNAKNIYIQTIKQEIIKDLTEMKMEGALDEVVQSFVNMKITQN